MPGITTGTGRAMAPISEPTPPRTMCWTGFLPRTSAGERAALAIPPTPTATPPSTACTWRCRRPMAGLLTPRASVYISKVPATWIKSVATEPPAASLMSCWRYGMPTTAVLLAAQASQARRPAGGTAITGLPRPRLRDTPTSTWPVAASTTTVTPAPLSWRCRC